MKKRKTIGQSGVKYRKLTASEVKAILQDTFSVTYELSTFGGGLDKTYLSDDQIEKILIIFDDIKNKARLLDDMVIDSYFDRYPIEYNLTKEVKDE